MVLVAAAPGRVLAQESVQSAQALYASAAYDEALAVLDRLRTAEPSPSEAHAINQQRALCLLALGRAQDAEQAITAVVQADPAYRPDETSTSPRVRAAFRDVRARLLPGIVQAEYADARRLYDEKTWADAAAAFQRVAALAADPDLGEAQIAALADVRVLADGFAKLSEAGATPPPPPAPEPAPAEPPAPVIDYEAVYDGSSPGVTPPVTLRQDLPRWTSATGALEVIITAQGVIERATIIQPIATLFDRKILDATKHWRYRPASLNGKPVRYKKTIKIAFQ